MKIQDIEIPYEGQRSRRYRFFEMLPGFISWFVLALPFVLSLINPALTVFFIIAYLLLWFVKSAGMSVRALQGFHKLSKYQKLDWLGMLKDLQSFDLAELASEDTPKWHIANIERIRSAPTPVKPDDVVHVVIIATYNESREVLEPTIQKLLKSNYDMDKVILVIAYEERGGPDVAVRAKALEKDYKNQFRDVLAIGHPAHIPNEVIGKGGNITYAARQVVPYLEKNKLRPINIIVTTLDADNRPHSNYLPAVTYTYCACPDPKYVSFQPIPLFTNNIWDAPAPMRVVATGNSFWQTIVALRPHMLRNFSAHAQSMQALLDTDFWSVRTIVEDGHQFWRTYFRYDGRHEVYPIFVPIYQDAVFAGGYIKTLKAQFVQMRRWAWGASDIAYVAEMGFFRPNNISKFDLWAKLLRLLEGHISWATSALMITFSAFIPLLFNSNDYGANQLPLMASRLQTFAMAGIIISIFFSLKTLPPKPKRYKSTRSVFMVVQWVFLPVTTIVYGSFSALDSQTRLMIGKYLSKFDVTEKAVVTDDNKTVL